MCLGNLSSDWSLTESTKTSLYGNIYDFPVDYVPLNGVKRIYDTHRYLMENMALHKMFKLIKKSSDFNVSIISNGSKKLLGT